VESDLKAAERKKNLFVPLHDGKWTRSDLRQAKFLGVRPEGMQAHLVFQERAQHGLQPSKLPIEKAVTDPLRLELDIQGATCEEERSRKRRRTARPVEQKPSMSTEGALAVFEEESGDEEQILGTRLGSCQ